MPQLVKTEVIGQVADNSSAECDGFAPPQKHTRQIMNAAAASAVCLMQAPWSMSLQQDYFDCLAQSG
jgi:hypothetical protein